MIIIFSIIFLILDLGTKIAVKYYFTLGNSVEIIKNFWYLTYVKNTGAAWSIMDNNTLLVSIISGVIILLGIGYIYKNKPKNNREKICYSLLLAGAIGNFINRIVYGYVIDFIDIKIFGYNYPIFNLADIFIVIGGVLLLLTWRCSNNDNRGFK